MAPEFTKSPTSFRRRRSSTEKDTTICVLRFECQSTCFCITYIERGGTSGESTLKTFGSSVYLRSSTRAYWPNAGKTTHLAIRTNRRQSRTQIWLSAGESTFYTDLTTLCLDFCYPLESLLRLLFLGWSWDLRKRKSRASVLGVFYLQSWPARWLQCISSFKINESGLLSNHPLIRNVSHYVRLA